MAKVRLELGSEADLLDEHQLNAALDRVFRSWAVEMMRSVKYIRFRGSSTVDSSGNLLINPSFDNVLGPKNSTVWSVKGIALTGITGTQFVDMRINAGDAVRPFSLPSVGDIAFEKFGSNELVLYDSDHLEFYGSSLTAGAVVVVTGRAEEIPITQIGRL